MSRNTENTENMEYDESLQPPSKKEDIESIEHETDKNGFIEEKKEHKEEEELNELLNNNKLSAVERWRSLVLSILRNTKCYSLMPESGKVVVFDSRLPVKHAFRALSENDIKCAPVWHSTIINNKGEIGDFIGFMTVTDFADILHFYAQDLSSFSRKVSELENCAVGNWSTFRKKHNQTEISRAFVFVQPNEPIFNAIHKMHQYFIHRMPVLQTHNKSILCILNHQTILRFVFNKSKIYHNQLLIHVSDVKQNDNDIINPYPKLNYDQKVSDAVTILSTNRKASAIPILDNNGCVMDAFMRSDIRFFARNQAYENLNVSIKEFLGKYRPTQFVPKCTQNDNLLEVLWEMLSKRCHVALVLDENKKLKTIFNYYHIFEMIINGQEMVLNNNDLENSDDDDQDGINISTDFLNDSNTV
eukprot:339157_1